MFGDFELKAKFKIIHENSGIQYRSKVIDAENWIVAGYQADMAFKPIKFCGMIYKQGYGGLKSRSILSPQGSIVHTDDKGNKITNDEILVEEKIQAKIKQREWNEYTVSVLDSQHTLKINGIITAQLTDLESSRVSKEGIIPLLCHWNTKGTDVQFKDITLRKF